MKKCPNCQKTFDDNMKFCQSDGTPLVVVADNQPKSDPYATMVANKEDLEIPAEIPKEESVKDSPDLMDDDDILGITGKNEEPDPLKTMVVSGNTADNIRLSIPDEAESKKEDLSEANTILTPNLPKFNEPNIAPPDLGNAPVSKPTPPKIESTPPMSPAKPSSPFEAEKPKLETPPKMDEPKESKSAPIPSPFDDSMPPGYAPPSTPPFEPPKEPMQPKPLNEIKKEEAPKSPFADASKPVAESNTEGWGTPPTPILNKIENQPPSSFDSPISNDLSSTTSGQNQTMAFVSLGFGVASFLCGLFLIGGLVAIFTGMKARKNANENPAEYGGGTFATIGMFLGIANVIISLLAILVSILIVAGVIEF